MTVRVGDFYNDNSDAKKEQIFSEYENAENYDIEKAFLHPKYSLVHVHLNDIALIKTKKVVKFGLVEK